MLKKLKNKKKAEGYEWAVTMLGKEFGSDNVQLYLSDQKLTSLVVGVKIIRKDKIYEVLARLHSFRDKQGLNDMKGKKNLVKKFIESIKAVTGDEYGDRINMVLY